MDTKRKIILVLLGLIFPWLASAQVQGEMMPITGGSFEPLYGADSNEVVVSDFLLDRYPITQAQYLDFVKENPKWRKSQVIALFADEGYLRNWDNDSTLGRQTNPKSPIVSVSWFAAKAYCDYRNKRLPTIDEWEYTARASETKMNAQGDSLFNQQIIAGYERPKTYVQEVGSTFQNYWGIYDMHGLVWEWTSDFNSVLISGESRQDVDAERNLFCAGGAVNASALMDYAAFMRYAFRGSIKANYCIQNLGFRCASDLKK